MAAVRRRTASLAQPKKKLRTAPPEFDTSPQEEPASADSCPLDLLHEAQCATKADMSEGAKEVHARVRAAFEHLGDLEKLLLWKRFFADPGADPSDPAQAVHRADDLGISDEELENVESDALRKLRGGKHQRLNRPTNRFN